MPLPSYRRTKIIATLGPATESEPALTRLIECGVDVIRLNMAHAKHDWTRTVIRRIRAISKKVGREVAIMMDIKGPEIRTGDVDVPIELRPGEIFDFTVKPGAERDNSEEIRSVDVNYQNLVNDIKVGDIVLVDNGIIRLEVRQKYDAHIRCCVLTPGSLTSRRHINLPGVRVNLPSFTEKDRGDTLVGLEEGIDFVALSFVREAADIVQLRGFLKQQNSTARIVAKIEDQQAISNLDEIIRATDVLMVARGDLGIEVPFEDLPIIQHRAVRTCLSVGRPVIVATHMLESMISQPVPTRAEITDVANAVYEQADCVMLSGETTIGKYPFECIRVMDSIARRVEEELAADFPEPAVFIEPRMKFMRAAVVMANEFPGSRIVIFTRRGLSAAGLAAHRPARAPILALTDNVAAVRQLRIVRSVEPYLIGPFGDPEKTLTRALDMLRDAGRVKAGDKLVIISDVLAENGDRVDSIQMRSVS
ncbi:Pyruvate kinase [Lacunisphaera limnophila]|uniref:Pyruvate kinase n=1 Tax=Lacunisphaera limnophila TaxID=1838286 RepID=A0A1D8ARL4_9BACT|nr:pyruvate kinase [Lacunisphaera limnophila]AOS43499.1 Pyruvate kinase [Lacunisphaera limnophila]